MISSTVSLSIICHWFALRALEYLLNHCRVTWIRQVGLRSIDREVEKGSEDRIAVSLGCLSVVLG